MLFKNREHAGELLAQTLMPFQYRPHTYIIGLARGGVVVAAEIAKILEIPLDILCPRKIGAPHNPELALGAVTASGLGFFNTALIKELNVSKTYLTNTIESQKKLSARRMKLYRGNRPPLNFDNLTLIIVDDGLATGATMKAAIQAAKDLNAASILVAIPVAPPKTLEEISKLVDDVFCLYSPEDFMAVGEFYQKFLPTEDKEVMDLMRT